MSTFIFGAMFGGCITVVVMSMLIVGGKSEGDGIDETSSGQDE